MMSSLNPILPRLEELYACYNKRSYVSPDPLQFLYDYPELKDREIAGMIASSLAYGGVKQILGSVARALAPMGHSPYKFLQDKNLSDLGEIYKDFKHRFATGADFALMLLGLKRMIAEYSSLEQGFMAGYDTEAETIHPSLSTFISRLHDFVDEKKVCYGYRHLLPAPQRGGASKRLHLFLRWMVRKDAVDPGGWEHVSPAQLIIPLDLHMHRISLALGLTERKQANLKTALEITQAFRRIVPHDPVRYDFVLTRLGIRTDTDMDAFIASCKIAAPE